MKFTLSNLFNGRLVDIQLDEEKGIEIPFVEGRYELEVPASGLVLVKSFGPLLESHSEEVAYEGGSPVPLPDRNYEFLNKELEYWWQLGKTTMRSGDEAVVTRIIYRIATPDELAPENVFAAADAQFR